MVDRTGGRSAEDCEYWRKPHGGVSLLRRTFSASRWLPVTAVASMTAICATLLLALAASPSLALKIELKDAAPDRIERQRQTLRGETLPGTPAPGSTEARLKTLDLSLGTPVLIRIFKEESELELWMLRDGRYEQVTTYPICNWSGSLGPKLFEGDKQSPEGFYTVTRRQLHRSGRWPRSLNLGFPNPYDRELLRTGSYLLIHGGCSSVGCYAMTNAVMKELFGIVEKALRAGQKHVPVHVFPFRMTDANLKRHADSEWIGFWRNLRAGYDSFEKTRVPPTISVCNGTYQIRDGSPSEVGLESRPLAMCGSTQKVLAAEAQLLDIVSHPFHPSALSAEQKKLLRLLRDPPKTILRRRREAMTRAGLSAAKIKRGALRRRRVTVSCNLRRPSCRRFLALKRRRLARRAGRSAKYAEKSRRGQRKASVRNSRRRSKR